MRDIFYSKDLGVILNDLKQAELSAYEQALVNDLESRIGDAATTGKRVLKYNIQPIAIKTLLEEILITLLQQQNPNVQVQLHVPPETTEVLADLFFLKSVLTVIFHYLADHGDLKLISVRVTQGEEKCIIEMEEPENPYVLDIPAKEILAASILTVCRKLMEDMNSELVYTHSKETGNYFRFKLLPA